MSGVQTQGAGVATTGPDGLTLETLFAPPPRLGWMYEQPAPPRQHPLRQTQPAPLELPAAPGSLALARRTVYAGLGLVAASALAVVFVLLKDVGDGLTLYAVGLCVAGVIFVSGLGREDRPLAGMGLAGLFVATVLVYNLGVPLVSGVLAFTGGAALLLGFPVVVLLRGKYLESQAAEVEADWARRAAEVQQQYAEAMRARDETISAFEADERRRWRTEPLWHPVHVPPAATTLTVVGGSSYGWEALVTTLGSSLLADGHTVTVLNFSERVFAAELCALARSRGSDVDVVFVPDHLDGVGLLSGFTPTELAGLLADTLHAGEDKLDRKLAISDRDILIQVCERLDARPLSIERIRAGLRVILRAEPWSERSVLDKAEHGALQRAFSDDLRQRTNLLQSAWDIERQLSALAGLANGLGTTGDLPLAVSHQLQVFELRCEHEALDNDYVVDLLFQLLLRSFRRSAASPRSHHAIVVGGADRLRSRHLADLARLTERTPVKLIYLFERYGPDARQTVGVGGGCAAFMRLGNDQDARAAADFIGREHTFVLTGLTRTTSQATTHSDSTTETTGAGGTYQPVLFGLLERYTGRSTSRSWGVTRGVSETTSTSSGTNEQRVYDLIVEPHQIQQLPETALFFVQVDTGRRRTVLADCNPDIAGLARVERGPGGRALEALPQP